MNGRLLDELITATRSSKPRDTGLTIASDSFSPIEDEVLEQTAEYIDFVKFGLSTPLLIEKSKLLERVSRYHALGLSVVSGGTLIEIAGRFGPPNLIFKATQTSQRTGLILEFGPAVNLAGVPVNEILTLEMQRLGLTPETLGLSRPVEDDAGSPASKFVYHLIKSEHPIDQTTLILRSGLPKRTVQGALSYLVNKGLVRVVSESSDMRKHKFTLR